MLSLFNECYSKEAIPSAWTKSIINPIPKNSGAQSKNPLEYRGIALTSAIYKLFCGVLNNRLKSWANHVRACVPACMYIHKGVYV